MPDNPDTPPFIHLRVHTEYSLVDGIVRIPELVKKAAELGMPAVAVTDWHNLFGLVKFYRAAQAAGIKPIAGADLRIHDPAEPETPEIITLLIQNRTGYLNLCRLISRSFMEGRWRGQPRIQREWLNGASDGLILLAGWESDLGRAIRNGRLGDAEHRLESWQRTFPGRLYLELQRTGRAAEQEAEHGLLRLAVDHRVPVAATNDVRFPGPDDFLAHEGRVCINQGRLLDDKRRPRHFVDQQYLKSPEEMAERFADIPQAIENTRIIAERCNLELQLGHYVLPDFPVPDGETIDSFLHRRSEQGLTARLEKHGPAPEYTRADYDQRLAHELDVITQMGFPGYFLIVADFIQWSRNNGVPVGPGRGSGAGSLVAWCLGITDLDPLRYKLLFERFLNPERVSMPDFDVDFCMDGRDRVIDYVAETYGRDQVCQIITYGTMAARAVVRDCGRVLGYSYGFVDSIAKLIPHRLDITLSKALEEEKELKERCEREEDTRAVIELALSLEGIARNAGKHAGGVVIAPGPLTDYTPLYTEPNSGSVVTQYDKNDVESVGLVKFDFLGLRTLTIIDWALATVNEQRRDAGEAPLDLAELPMDDGDTFKLLQAANTTAVFQLESRGMKDLLRKLKPDSFEDIVAAVALFRPGPLDAGMVGDYIDRKHGRAPVSFPDPKLAEVLGETYGVILYQEQVMQIAQILAGYSLGAADLLRRAMGKKNPQAMAEQRAIFVQGATERGLDPQTAEGIFNLMETFAGYGFNKSHSVAYALLSYHTAWLKAHYPAEFMAAVLSADLDNTDKIAHLVEDCKALGLTILPPDVNYSGYRFKVEHPPSLQQKGGQGGCERSELDQSDSGITPPSASSQPEACASSKAKGGTQIRYGLGAIKGLGQGAVESIIAACAKLGGFSSLYQLCREADLGRLNRRALEVLIRSGACDSLHANRAALLHDLPDILARAERFQQDRAAGQVDLFGGGGSTRDDGDDTPPSDVPSWSNHQRLRGERETLGLYLSGHPLDDYREELAEFTTCHLGEVASRVIGERVPMTLAGLVVAIRRRPGRGAFITLDDGHGRLEVAMFDRLFHEQGDRAAKDETLVVSGRVGNDEYSGGFRMVADEVMDLDQARGRFAKGVELVVRQATGELDRDLAAAFTPYRGGQTPVWLKLINGKAEAMLRLGDDWSVEPSGALLAALSGISGVSRARIRY